MYRYISLAVSAIWWSINLLWGCGIQGKASGPQNRKKSSRDIGESAMWLLLGSTGIPLVWQPHGFQKPGHPSPVPLAPKRLKLTFSGCSIHHASEWFNLGQTGSVAISPHLPPFSPMVSHTYPTHLAVHASDKLESAVWKSTRCRVGNLEASRRRACWSCIDVRKVWTG